LAQSNLQNPYLVDSFFNKLNKNYVFDKSDLYKIINDNLGYSKGFSNGRAEDVQCDSYLRATVQAALNDDWARAAIYFTIWYDKCIQG
jgi:hypothetical protein